ncbi:MAG: DUF167 domain-containing protein [Acidimicrobiia bacterium]
MQTHNDDLFTVGDGGQVELNVHAQPGAGRTQVTGRHGAALKVRVAAPPEAGRANQALAVALADAFRVGEKDVELVSGDKSRTKRFRISGLDEDAFAFRLDEVVADGAIGPGPARSRRR